MDIPWLNPLVQNWRRSAAEGRAPHALLLLGAKGTGKRCAAAWLAAERLGLLEADSAPSYPLAIPAHADIRWISPPEDKQSIGIEQIRELIASMSLTSYEGRGKVAVVEPANAMTAAATASLLKTLEEPPGDALLVLIADHLGRLPATILSRCQRVNVGLPEESASLAWLERLQPATNWPAALRAGGDAPLAAIQAAERLEEIDSMAKEFAALAERRASPLEVAGRWAKREPEFVLHWLGRQVQRCILRAFGALPTGSGVSDSVLQRMDRRNLFCYLDAINKLRGQPAGSYNLHLNLEGLLIDWAGGLPNREF